MKLKNYGGQGTQGYLRRQGDFVVKYGSGKEDREKHFDSLEDAEKFFNGLHDQKALWDVTGIPELLECFVKDVE